MVSSQYITLTAVYHFSNNIITKHVFSDNITVIIDITLVLLCAIKKNV